MPRQRRKKLSRRWVIDLGHCQHEVAPTLFRDLASRCLIVPSSNPRRARVADGYFGWIDQWGQLRFHRVDQRCDPYAIPSQFRYLLERLKYRIRYIGDHEWLWQIQAEVEGLRGE